MLEGVNFKVLVEFLNGVSMFAEAPVWLQSSSTLFTYNPVTREETCVHYVTSTKSGLPLYRERPAAKILRFPVERTRGLGEIN